MFTLQFGNVNQLRTGGQPSLCPTARNRVSEVNTVAVPLKKKVYILLEKDFLFDEVELLCHFFFVSHFIRWINKGACFSFFFVIPVFVWVLAFAVVFALEVIQPIVSLLTFAKGSLLLATVCTKFHFFK